METCFDSVSMSDVAEELLKGRGHEIFTTAGMKACICRLFDVLDPGQGENHFDRLVAVNMFCGTTERGCPMHREWLPG